MLVQDQNGGVEAQKQRLLQISERIRETLEYDSISWSVVTGLSEEDYAKVRRGELELPISALLNISEHFELALDHFKSGRIDFQVLSARIRGNSSYLPEKYLHGAFSKRVSTLNLLDFIERTRGWRTRLHVLRRNQLSEGAFANPDALISVRVPLDLTRTMTELGFTRNEFLMAGVNAAFTYRNSNFGREVVEFSEPHSLYEAVFEYLVSSHLEKNCTYRIIRRFRSGFLTEIKPTQDILDALKDVTFGNPEFCSLKRGIIAAIPAIAGLPLADVREVRCIHNGDPACHFEVDYSPIQRRLKMMKSGRFGTSG